ncbi:helix-turn-helix transcriptional regulator [Alkalimarinus alittae]|uniref:AlpA family transcriptional regulator n=1 Tax=Alkalimarinus alittae TaxID=2961619 RepID=A0ABY6N1A5_9ALTE|nr:AlpA family transcriptional regulator [Alkalimarinus alittae]UZE95891.1 AlpA family transcriptional regulator [Alkalimarinus alittae]
MSNDLQDFILRFPEVKKRTSLSRSTIWRLEQSGSFPQRIQLSPNAVGWKESDIRQWLESRTAA